MHTQKIVIGHFPSINIHCQPGGIIQCRHASYECIVQNSLFLCYFFWLCQQYFNPAKSHMQLSCFLSYYYPPLPEHTCTPALAENCICNVLSKNRGVLTEEFHYFYEIKLCIHSCALLTLIMRIYLHAGFFSCKGRYRNWRRSLYGY